jgi:hypothetical protein
MKSRKILVGIIIVIGLILDIILFNKISKNISPSPIINGKWKK